MPKRSKTKTPVTPVVIPTSSVSGSGNYGVGTSGTTTWTAPTTILPSPITWAPTTTTIPSMWTSPSTSSTGWYSTTNVAPTPTYFVFKLPKSKVPELVFLNGLALTLGMLGSKAEAAFVGDSLVLKGDLFTIYRPRLTVILQYKTEVYHYAIETTNYAPNLKPNSKVLDAELLSVVKRS